MIGGRSSDWRDRIVGLLIRNRAMAGSLAALALKVGGTGLMMGIFLMAARSMSPQEFGQLAVSFNALSFVAVVAVFGQDVLVVRSWGEYVSAEAHGLALGACQFGWTVVVGAALTFGLLTFAIAVLNPAYHFLPLEAAAGAAFLSVQIVLLFSTQITRVVISFGAAEFNREITWRLMLLPIVVAGVWTGLSPTAFYGAAAVGMVLAVALQLSILNRGFPAPVRAARSEMRRREWARRAGSMWSSAVLEAAAQYAEVMLLGLLVSPAAAGVYFVSARMANVFAMMSSGLHSYTVTHASNLYHAGKNSALQALFRSVMTMALLIAAPLIVLVTVFGTVFLNVFGRHYADGYWVLITLSIGSFTAAMAGPSNGLLLVTGHEKLYSRVLFVALLVRVGLITWAAPRFGAIGAAGAWTLVTGPVAIGLAAATRRLTGIDPSIFSLVGRTVPSTALELDPG